MIPKPLDSVVAVIEKSKGILIETKLEVPKLVWLSG